MGAVLLQCLCKLQAECTAANTGQRLQAVAEQQAQAADPSVPKQSEPARAAGTYSPPDWGGQPDG